jgi:hypothetical protein
VYSCTSKKTSKKIVSNGNNKIERFALKRTSVLWNIDANGDRTLPQYILTRVVFPALVGPPQGHYGPAATARASLLSSLPSTGLK